MVTLTLIAVLVIVYGELSAKVENNGTGNPGPLQVQLTMEGGNTQGSGASSGQESYHSACDKPEGHNRQQGRRDGNTGSVYIEVQREFYTSLQSCLGEGRGASVTLCCSKNLDEQLRQAPSSSDSHYRQRDNFGACAYESMPVA